MYGVIRTKKDKIKGIVIILLIFILSCPTYMVSMSITWFSAVYTCFMIKAVLLTYSKYIGYLDTKNLIKIAIICFLIVTIGYYFAYVYYYYPFFKYQGLTFGEVFIKLVPMVSQFDKDSIPGMFFFIITVYLIGVGLNFQYIKHERLNELDKRLKQFKKEVGIYDNEEEETSKHKSALIWVIVLSLMTIGYGIYNDTRFSEVASHQTFKSYSTELEELKAKNEKAYNVAKDYLDNREKNYNFQADTYFIKGEDNTINIYANLDGDNYILYCDQIYYDAKKNEENYDKCYLDMTWNDWTGEVISLEVHAVNEGYGVIIITNDVNDDNLYIFIDNINERTN